MASSPLGSMSRTVGMGGTMPSLSNLSNRRTTGRCSGGTQTSTAVSPAACKRLR